MDISSMMAEDSANKPVRVPTDDELKTVAELAHRQVYLETYNRRVVVDSLLSEYDPSVLELEEALKQKKEELSKIREFDLPNAVESLGLSEFKLLDGSQITIKEDVYTGITDENREGAFKWLEQTGNDGIIKNEVKCPFGKGQDEEARHLVSMLTEEGYSFTNVRGVHPQTLKAFVRKQLEEGKPIPLDVFSVHIKKVASVKQPKQKGAV